MVIPHSGLYPHAKFEGNLLLFKFGPHTKSGLTIPQCGRRLPTANKPARGRRDGCLRPMEETEGRRAEGGRPVGLTLRNSKSGFGMGFKFEE